MCLPSVSIPWHKQIAKFCITCWKVEVTMFSKIDYWHTRPCCLKLKLSRKLSLNHNWDVVVLIIHPNNEYALGNIFWYFQRKINNKSQLNEAVQKKSANILNLIANVWMWYSEQFSTIWNFFSVHKLLVIVLINSPWCRHPFFIPCKCI